MLNYLDGYDRKEVTLKSSDEVAKGKTVSMESDYTVKPAEASENFIGVCTYTHGTSASVLLKGYVTVSYSGTAPAHGYNKLSADGNGGVKTDADGRDILVVCVDTRKSVCGIIL